MAGQRRRHRVDVALQDAAIEHQAGRRQVVEGHASSGSHSAWSSIGSTGRGMCSRRNATAPGWSGRAHRPRSPGRGGRTRRSRRGNARATSPPPRGRRRYPARTLPGRPGRHTGWRLEATTTVMPFSASAAEAPRLIVLLAKMPRRPRTGVSRSVRTTAGAVNGWENSSPPSRLNRA